MATLQILEGGRDDHDDMIAHFNKMGFEILPTIQDLYEAPEQLRRLQDLDPDYIYIRTVGMMQHIRHRDALVDEFKAVAWMPRNVIFFDEGSAMTYLDIARPLAKSGTKMWEAPFLLDETPELRPMSWI